MRRSVTTLAGPPVLRSPPRLSRLRMHLEGLPQGGRVSPKDGDPWGQHRHVTPDLRGLPSRDTASPYLLTMLSLEMPGTLGLARSGCRAALPEGLRRDRLRLGGSSAGRW